MLETLRIQNFKSWKDTGTMQFGALTGFWGNNSSGKTSILQFLLMLKQTVESSDRSRVLHLGDEHTYVELGTLHDAIHNHADPGHLKLALSWQKVVSLHFEPDYDEEDVLYANASTSFQCQIDRQGDTIKLVRFKYQRSGHAISVKQLSTRPESPNVYTVEIESPERSSNPRRIKTPFRAGKFYILPVFPRKNIGPEALGKTQDLVYDFEVFFDTIYYLGPLRDYPKRLYSWAGEQTKGVGNRGERAVAALLSSRGKKPSIGSATSKRQKKVMLEEHVAYWLKELGLIHSFAVRPIAPNRKEYEVRVRKTADAPEVFITDVGFGVSQLLPVLVLLFYVPEGSTIILEQPEIHLHPAVQAGLADVMLDAIKRRNVQIILESHSEHLLHRLQTRIAENKVISADQVKLYFTKFEKEASEMTPLELDTYGNICNWPKNFFGDQFGEAAARMEEELKRRQAAGEK